MRDNKTIYKKYGKPWIKRQKAKGWKTYYYFGPATLVYEMRDMVKTKKETHPELWEDNPTQATFEEAHERFNKALEKAKREETVVTVYKVPRKNRGKN